MITGDCEHTWAKCGSYDRVKLLFRLAVYSPFSGLVADSIVLKCELEFQSVPSNVLKFRQL